MENTQQVSQNEVPAQGKIKKIFRDRIAMLHITSALVFSLLYSVSFFYASSHSCDIMRLNCIDGHPTETENARDFLVQSLPNITLFISAVIFVIITLFTKKPKFLFSSFAILVFFWFLLNLGNAYMESFAGMCGCIKISPPLTFIIPDPV